MFQAQTLAEVPQGMKNYLEKYRKFGEAFGELMRDRSTGMMIQPNPISCAALVIPMRAAVGMESSTTGTCWT